MKMYQISGKIMEGQDRVSVLAGKNKIDDMLVFLVYRKLKKVLVNKPDPQARLLHNEKKEVVE